MKKLKCGLICALVVAVICLSAMLVACDGNEAPAKYKPYQFYGTYTQFANDYYGVICSRYVEEEGGGWTGEIMADVVAVRESSYLYKDKFEEGKISEREYNPELLHEIEKLMEKIGTSITVKDGFVVMSDVKEVVCYDRTAYYAEQECLAFFHDEENVGIGYYLENGTMVFGVAITAKIVCGGNKYTVVVNKNFCK